MDNTERYERGQTEGFLRRVRELHEVGSRLVQIGCLEVAGHDVGADDTAIEVIYSFDRDYELTHLRLTVEKGDHVPSVSTIYDTAFLYENEIHDLYGVSFDGLSLDFGGTFYQKEVVRPFCSTNGKTPVTP